MGGLSLSKNYTGLCEGKFLSGPFKTTCPKSSALLFPWLSLGCCLVPLSPNSLQGQKTHPEEGCPPVAAYPFVSHKIGVEGNIGSPVRADWHVLIAYVYLVDFSPWFRGETSREATMPAWICFSKLPLAGVSHLVFAVEGVMFKIPYVHWPMTLSGGLGWG